MLDTETHHYTEIYKVKIYGNWTQTVEIEYGRKKSNDSSHSLVHVELVVAICNYIERKKERNDELK